ncbi:DUF551 domain-containing protein [Escherichia coli]|nr:DUF551 domain-containing protein [Escherichia coli]
MSAITKERIELFIKNPLDNGLTRGEQMELARIALTSLEAEPVAWLHSDNGLGIPAITRSKNVADSWLSKGWYVQPLYIAKPVPVVPDARPSLNNGIVGFDEGWNACRATMLHGAKPVSQTYKLNKLSGNSPVTPDGWVMVPKRLTAENGAKGALSGEFSETTFISCPECFGDDDCDTCDGSGRIKIKVPVTWTTIKSIWDKGIAYFAAEPPQEVNRG